MMLTKDELLPRLGVFKKLIDVLPEFICLKNREGHWIEANEFALQVCGVDRCTYKGKALDEQNSWCNAGMIERSKETDKKAWETGHPIKIQEEVQQKDGSYIYLELIKQATFDEEGNPLFLFVTGRDITQHKEKEEELSVALELLESVLEGTTDAILIVDTKENLIKVNHAFENMFGWEEHDLLSDEIDSHIIIPDEFKAESKSIMGLLAEGSTVPSFETQRVRRDGLRIDVSISFSAIRNMQGRVIGFCLIYRDISAQKKAERALRESEAKYRVIAEHSKDLIAVANPNGELIYSSPSHEAILGFSSNLDEINRILFSRIHPDDWEFLRAAFAKAKMKKKPFTFECRLMHQNGDWLVMETNAVPVLNEWNEIESFVTIARDITATKETEELIRKSEKLSVLGELAAGVAHEIRNPLTSLIGFAQLLKETDEEMKTKYVAIMLTELKRINDIVGELMLVAKPQAVHFEYSSLEDMLQSVIRLLDTQAIIKNIQIQLKVDKDIPSIYCVENQLKQLFINLLKNSIEAMGQGGIITLAVIKKKGSVVIKIEDQGSGIPKNRLGKLGEPFYTTKEKGTGLGLMVCYKIVKEHYGNISFESEKNKGTTVQVKLPIYPFSVV
ncbi:PAS domain S-box protein [Fictibacillus sp. WQ 8-8]|uniref:PAS domain-containing sensor histidine kinase n=1 Tax=Fictibacillus sp. WQ 8-8 TaxID=2938788 RepID=UPI00210F0289|nr:PAS domain-containing sensor histidine kinase [Fictibacillus sp. WQ 8-8]MCQ6266906.1 PAS domain S-box protein [Fictibacillus sp. WQ 8-8]